MHRSSFWLTALGAVVLLCTSVAQGADDKALTVGDLVFVNVHREPDLSVTGQVDEDGNINLPHVGKVSISGLSPNEASARVATALRVFVKNPRVNVSRSRSGMLRTGMTRIK